MLTRGFLCVVEVQFITNREAPVIFSRREELQLEKVCDTKQNDQNQSSVKPSFRVSRITSQDKQHSKGQNQSILVETKYKRLQNPLASVKRNIPGPECVVQEMGFLIK